MCLFSCVSIEERTPAKPSLRQTHLLAHGALQRLDRIWTRWMPVPVVHPFHQRNGALLQGHPSHSSLHRVDGQHEAGQEDFAPPLPRASCPVLWYG